MDDEDAAGVAAGLNDAVAYMKGGKMRARLVARPEESDWGMKLSDFAIGTEFMMGEARWRCTDVGTRTVAAIKLDAPDPSWYNGPPYAVVEYVIDEDDMEACEPAKG